VGFEPATFALTKEEIRGVLTRAKLTFQSETPPGTQSTQLIDVNLLPDGVFCCLGLRGLFHPAPEAL